MKTLLIDANGLAYACFYTMGGLSYRGNPTGIQFGFLKMILGLAGRFKSNDVLLCWDAKPTHRLKLFPAYKQNRRDKTPEEQEVINMAKAQMDDARDNLVRKLGFVSYHVEGYEADDLIASIVLNNRGSFMIVSSDHDLYQLLSPKVRMYEPIARKITSSLDLPCSPEDWAMVKAVGGCKSDGVPGVPGVAENTAIKYVTGVLPHHHKTYKAIDQNGALINLNLRLVSLPFVTLKQIKLGKCPPYADERKFKKVCRQYGIHSITGKDWECFVERSWNEGEE